jgi:hypothetical protein
MRDSDWYTVLAGFFILGVLVIGAVAIVEESPGIYGSPKADPNSPDYLYLTISFNPVTGNDEYFPANFTVPVDTLVMIIVTNFDNGTNPVPSLLRSVTGTVGDTELVTEGNPTTTTSVAALAPGSLSHTFSIMQIELNAPIPPAPSGSSPSVTSFGVYFNQTGTFDWMCQAPCNPVSMETPGLMSGIVTVE